MVKVITAPEMYEKKENDILCFLAGGITNCKEWQSDVINEIKRLDEESLWLKKSIAHDYTLVLFNPRRENFSVENENDITEQIEWEFYNLERADIFSMYFCGGESVQPICLYELGRNFVRMQQRFPNNYLDRISISIEADYKRLKDVMIQMQLAYSDKYLYDDIIIGEHDSLVLSHAFDIYSMYSFILHHCLEKQVGK